MSELYLYDICYKSFLLFLSEMDGRFNDSDKLNQIIIDILRNKNSIFNAYLKKHLDEFNIDLEVAKRIIMLIIVSKSYIMNYYDFVHEINITYSEETIEKLESLSRKEILDIFLNPSYITKDLIKDFTDYLVRPYIFHTKSKKLVLESGKFSILFKLNPLEVLDIWDYIDDDELLESENLIQTFFDLYDKTITEVEIDETGDSKNYESVEDFEFSLFTDNLYEFFKEDESKITLFLSYIFSNVYETLVIEKSSGCVDYKKYFDLIPLFENLDIYELKDRFLSDKEFAFDIIDIFVLGNQSLIENELIEKRDKFKEKGDVALLRRLNPYYEKEEIVYEKIKETSEN